MAQDMITFKSWGIKYVKIDRCFAVDSPPVRAHLPDTFSLYKNATPDLAISMILAGTDVLDTGVCGSYLSTVELLDVGQCD